MTEISTHLELVCSFASIDSEAEKSRGRVDMTANQQAGRHSLAHILQVTVAVVQITGGHQVAVLAAHTVASNTTAQLKSY